MLEALDSILTGCDEDIVRLVARSFKKRGIEVVTGVQVEGHTPKTDGRPRGQGRRADVRRRGHRGLGGPAAPHRGAGGRRASAVEINERGFVVADEYQRTGVPGVWAVGDVVAGTPQLAHVGFAEAIVAVKGMLGETVVPVDYGRVPWAIYCHPEVAFCGMTEAQAKATGIPVVTKKDPFGGNSRAQIIGDTEGVVKIVAEQRPDGIGRADPRRAHGRSVGDRATRRRLPGRQLGGTARRGGVFHPAAPVSVRVVRRDDAGTDRKGIARWLMSRCRSWARR